METEIKHPDLSGADALTVAKEACYLLLAGLSLDVKLIYAGGSALTDYYVVGYARSSTQVKALASRIEDGLAASFVPLRRVEGMDTAQWVLLDFGDVIVHIFGEEAGSFYRFERLFREEAFLPLDDVLDKLNGNE